jgi:hypothetical protein
MSKMLIAILLFCIAAPDKTKAQNFSNNYPQKAGIDTAEIQTEDDPGKPRFPSKEQLEKIKKRQEILGKSGINVYIGYAAVHRKNVDLNSSFTSMESEFGFQSSNEFNTWWNSVNLGFRARFTENFSLLWEYLFGGEPSDNDFRLSSASICALYTFLPKAPVSLSFGPGLALQRIKASRDYSQPVGSNGAYLVKLNIDTGNKLCYPMMALLDIKADPVHPRYSFFMSMKYVFGPKETVTQQVYAGNPPSTIEVDMTNISLSAGMSVGF